MNSPDLINPTYRDAVRRRFRPAQVLMLGGIISLVAAQLTGKMHLALTKATAGAMLAALAVGIIAFAVSALIMIRVKCPKCGKRLASVAYHICKSGRSRVDFCPYCGVDFDSPMPPPEHRLVS